MHEFSKDGLFTFAGDFSQLHSKEELERVGLNGTFDIVNSGVVAFLKAGIQKQIYDCNISKCACEELLEFYKYKGFIIVLDDNIRPNIKALPTAFSAEISLSNVDGEEQVLDMEHQKAVNYASWMIDEFVSNPQIEITKEVHENGIPYPINLLLRIFGEQSQIRYFHSRQFCEIAGNVVDTVLDTLTVNEKKLLHLRFQKNIEPDSILRFTNLQGHVAVEWGMNYVFHKILIKALRKLRHPSRSKRLTAYLDIYEYLNCVEHSTIEDIHTSFLYEERLSWIDENGVERKLNWHDYIEGYKLCGLMNSDDLPSKLIYHVREYKWKCWPIGLLMGESIKYTLSSGKVLSLERAYFSTGSDNKKYILVHGILQNNESFYSLFEFIKGTLEKVEIDTRVLKNLCCHIEKYDPEESDVDSKRALYDAEKEFCVVQLSNDTSQRDNEYYKMFLELLDEKLKDINPWNISIKELDLSVRSYNCLKRAGINTVFDIVAYQKPAEIHNLGRKNIEEIVWKLQKYGVNLGEWAVYE